MAKGKVLEALVTIAGQVDPSLQKSLKQANGSFAKVKQGAKVAGAAIGVGMGAAVAATAAAGKALLDLGSDFDSANDAIRIGTGATGDALDSLMGDMKEVYKSVPTSMEDASSAIADYNTRLGLTGEPLQELSKQALQVSDMLGEDLSATIEDSSKAFQQWNVASEDMSGAMDYIFKVSQSTGTGFNDLMTDMQKYGAQMQQLGFGFDESAALIGQLDKAGVNSGMVLKGMKKSISEMAKEGISASDGLSKYCDSIKNASSETEAIQIATEAFGSGAASTMAAAIRDGTLNVDDLTKSLQESSETIGGAAGDTYDFSEKLQMMKQNAQVAFEPLANGIFDLANDAMPYLQSAFDDIIPVITDVSQEILPIIGEIGEELFPVIGDSIKDVMGIVKQAAPFMTTVAKNVVGFMSQLIPILTQIAQSIMPVIETILTAVFDVIAQLMPVLGEIISAILPVVQQLITAIAPVIAQLLQALSPIISLLAQLITALLPPILQVVQTLMPVLTTVIGIISTGLTVALQVLSPVISGIIDLVGGIASVFSSVFSGLVGVVSTPINAIISLVNKAIGAINGISVDVPDWVPVMGGKHFGFNIPQIPMLATGGFTDGVSIAGEAGTEAVISFDPAYRSENLSYWAKAGQMLGASDSDLLSLLEDSNGSRGGSTEYNLGGVTFAPNITVQGSADKGDILEAIRQSESEFFDLLEEFMEQKRGGTHYAASYSN